MNTNYDNEATQYQTNDSEATRFEESEATQKDTTASAPTDTQAKSGKSGLKRTLGGAATGLLIGGLSSTLMGMKSSANEPEKEHESDNHKEELSHPEWVDDHMQVATSVNDDMSFGEAFATARAEVGPGGCFEWHGQLYGTYTAEEWNSMSAEERAEYSNHFSWNHIDHSSSNVAQHATNESANSVETTGTDDDIEIVSVNHSDNSGQQAHNGVEASTEQAEVVTESEVSTESEIEILGVVHDNDSGANIGGMLVDGQEVILIDVNNDMEFDYLATDLNGNGQVDEGELMDIQGQGLTVNDLGGLSDPTGNLFASNDTVDYSADSAIYEG